MEVRESAIMTDEIVNCVYDPMNYKIYLLSGREDKHRIINVMDLIPLNILKYDIVNGYIRRHEISHLLVVPPSLCELVMSFYQ